MTKVAIFPGSFDPFTKGHEEIVRRALPLFGELIIAIGVNSNKNYLFPLELRKKWIRKVFNSEPKVRVEDFQGLTINFCRQAGATVILRGLRNSSDYEYETGIAQMNRVLGPEIETLYLPSSPKFIHYSSTIVRDIYRNGGDISQFVPEAIEIE